MNITDLFKKEFKLPPFNRRHLFYGVLLLLLPNFAFLLLTAYTQTARPLLNLDYFIVALLLLLPWKTGRILAVPFFWLALLFDVIMFVMQLFPFMNLAGVIYLTPFLSSAPLLYQLLALGLLIYALLMPWLLFKISRQTGFFQTAQIAAVLFVASYFTGHLVYYKPAEHSLFGGENFYYGKSQFELYRSFQNQSFLEAMDTNPEFLPLKFKRASEHLQQPRSSKILLIVNESWGQPQSQALQNAVLEKLLAQKDRVSHFEQGHFHFAGATVEGEMRELCATGIQGFALRNTPSEKFAQCLPHVLKQQGYATYALHGASSQMYDRFSWYPKAGFQHFASAETLAGKPRCHAFNGVCDSALFDDVRQTFGKHDKLFYYWLTLSTHSPYAEEDLHNHRLKCSSYGMPEDATVCRNFKLQAQFFDDLAQLVQQNEMKGVEVLVVGDHTPPTPNLGEGFKYMQKSDVAWVHFKIKD